MKIDNINPIVGECITCKNPIYLYTDYIQGKGWYCSNKKCVNHFKIDFSISAITRNIRSDKIKKLLEK